MSTKLINFNTACHCVWCVYGMPNRKHCGHTDHRELHKQMKHTEYHEHTKHAKNTVDIQIAENFTTNTRNTEQLKSHQT